MDREQSAKVWFEHTFSAYTNTLASYAVLYARKDQNMLWFYVMEVDVEEERFMIVFRDDVDDTLFTEFCQQGDIERPGHRETVDTIGEFIQACESFASYFS